MNSVATRPLVCGCGTTFRPQSLGQTKCPICIKGWLVTELRELGRVEEAAPVQTIQTHVCSKCREGKPLDSYYLSPKDKPLQPCKTCRVELLRARRRAKGGRTPLQVTVTAAIERPPSLIIELLEAQRDMVRSAIAEQLQAIEAFDAVIAFYRKLAPKST